MDKFKLKLEEKFGSLTVIKLKEELLKRNASLNGRKKDLIDRLIFYELNNNFGNNVKTEKDVVIDVIKTPDVVLYKDINSSSPTPTLTNAHILAYMKIYDKEDVSIAKEMYDTGYLHHVRYCIEDNLYFVKSKCSAQMRKAVVYEVNASIRLDGEIHECSCECTAGQNKESTCKHLACTLFAVRDMYEKKEMITSKTTTENLQKFHQPAKRYSGSPVKARNITYKQYKPIVYSDESEDDEAYNTYFQNLIKSRGFNSNMAIKQLTVPANPIAYLNDHSYLSIHNDARYILLKDLFLFDVSLQDIEKVELDTLNQSNSSAWFEYRRVRITASRFYECSKDLNEKQSIKLAQSILNPKIFTSKATSHGKLYETAAIETFEKYLLQNKLSVTKCGLFIMKDYPFLGASPDGMLAMATVVEVKCPYTSRYEILSEKNVSFLYKDQNGNLLLEENHPYYYQVQGQLMVTGRHYCDFLIYSFKSLIRITIKRNETFISKMFSKLKKFYYNYLRPAIYNEFLYRDYKIKCECSVLKSNPKKYE